MINGVKDFMPYFSQIDNDIKDGEIFIDNRHFEYIKWTSKDGYDYWLYPRGSMPDIIKIANGLI